MQPESGDRSGDKSGKSHRVVDLEERNWLPRHCRGDRRAFVDLLAAYRRPIYSYLVRSGIPAPDRDDLFQSIVLKIHQAAASYQPAKPLRPWLFVIAANTVRNHFRDGRGPASLLSDGDLDVIQYADPQPGPERIAEDRQTIDWLEQAILQLPDQQRQVLILVSVVGLAQQDAAQALNLPLNTVKTHLRRARLLLAKSMSERDGPDNDPGE
jgi:RNA polymerase sigma-70 factor (ECF subfamily)